MQVTVPAQPAGVHGHLPPGGGFYTGWQVSGGCLSANGISLDIVPRVAELADCGRLRDSRYNASAVRPSKFRNLHYSFIS